MLRAFAPVPVVELSSKERIQAIYSTNDRLFVGLASGALKVYEIDDSQALSDPDPSSAPSDTSKRSPAKLLTTIDKFIKGSIEQLLGLEEARVLIVLSGGYVHLYDLDTLAYQERLHRTKGAVVFATSSELEFKTPFALPPNTAPEKRPSVADVQRSVSRLVVAAKKKLHCYEWQGAELIGSKEITVPERPRSLTFIKPDRILCGLVVEYFVVDIPASQVSPIFAAGRPVGAIDGVLAGVAANIGSITSSSSASSRKQGCALAARLPEDESVVLVNEFSSAFFSSETGSFMKSKRQIKFKDVPSMLGYSYPFVLSVTANGKKLEVRNPKTYTLLQSINFPTLQHFNDGKNPFVASSRQIWKLSRRSFEEQIEELIGQNQLDEAIALIENVDDVFVSDRSSKLRELKMRRAEILFSKLKFSQSMTLFSEVSAPPERVLKLYPEAISGVAESSEAMKNGTDIPTPEETSAETNGEKSHGPAEVPPTSEATEAEKVDDEERPDEVEASTDAPTDASTSKADANSVSPSQTHDIPTITADTVSLADSTNAEAQKKKDLEIFDRFLRPTTSNSSSSKVDNRNAVGQGSRPAADTLSLSDSLANFLSFGKSSTMRTARSELGNAEYTGPDSMDGKALMKAVRCLLIYLIDARRKIARLTSLQSGTITEEDFDRTASAKLNLASYGSDLEKEACIVDTALLRCYIIINPQLVGPLVRLPNHCDKNAVRQQLLMYGKYSELVDFYFNKKLHGDALALLKQLSDSKKVSEFNGPEHIVRYLQKLGQEHLDLIFEYAKEPVNINEEYGVEIFMANTPEAESLSRKRVEQFLLPISRKLTMKYLEHIVFGLNDLSPDFHNDLALTYLEDVKTNAQLYSSDDEMVQRPVRKLLRLLRESSQYRPEKILAAMPRDSSLFMESKAVLFSRLGEHKRALEIFVFSMKDSQKAQEYCMNVYDSDVPNSKSVFYTLLELYLRPPAKAATNGYGATAPSLPTLRDNFDYPGMNLEAALELLSQHGSRLSAVDALELLPPDIKLTSLGQFFESHLRETNTTINRDRISAALLKAELVRTQQLLVKLKSKNVIISDTKLCPVCLKRLGSSVISVFPNRTVVHYGCAKAYKESSGPRAQTVEKDE
ncbi:hypothetical protein BZA70DRAFT_259594 [Myxozyma melibiosi]|uniref:CNH domain-containing protein n=1 Tax=Myxozyma melibiosi TaxID=54550 RepID=A0ABR1F1Y3_9ASCO